MAGETGRLTLGRRVGLVALGLIVAPLIAFLGLRTPDTDPIAMRAKYATRADRFLELGDGLRVRVRDTGPRTAPALMLLHGAESSLETWTPWAARLDARYRVIRFDLPGHGLTGIGRTERYSTDALPNVVERVRARLGVGPMVLAGSSFGGGVAWRYALRHPDRLTGLVLIGATGRPDPDGESVPLAFRVMSTPGLRNVAALITPRSMVKGGVRAAFHDPRKATGPMVDRTWELLRLPGNRSAMIARSSEPRIAASAALLRRIRVATLILWGADDANISVRSAHWFARAIPGSRLIVYPETGHLPMEERADASAADVATFIDGVLGTGSPGMTCNASSRVRC